MFLLFPINFNIYFQISTQSKIFPYFGIGMNYSIWSISTSSINYSIDSGLGWHLFTGIRGILEKKVFGFFELNYGANNGSFKEPTTGLTFNLSSTGIVIMAGLGLCF